VSIWRDLARFLSKTLLLPLALVMALAPSMEGAAITGSDFLKANGRQMRNNYGGGAVVNLRGTNLGGWFLQEPWMTPAGGPIDEWNIRETLTSRFGEATKDATVSAYQDAWITAADLDNIQAMGMNFVRVPVWYLEFMDKYGNWRANGFGRLDWLVSQCAQRGIYVLIDMHGVSGGQNTFDNCGQASSDPQFWHNATYQERTIALWQGVAAHYKGNPAVAGYDLLNEPDRVDGWGSANAKAQLNDTYNRLYQAIRAVDPDHTIFMEAAWEYNMLESPSTYGWTNVVYELHFYAMSGNQAQDWATQNGWIDWILQSFNDHAYWNVPLYAGEFCFFDFLDLWGKALQGFNDRGVLWTNWNYKVTCGGNWGFYYNPTGVQWPNLYTDDAATIQNKWRTFTTAGHFQANTNFINTVKQYTQQQSSYSSIKASANNTFVCAENAGAGQLIANRPSPGDWEAFKVITNSDGTISLQAKANGKYVMVDMNNGAKLIASSGAIGTWEKFTRVTQSNGTVALKALANNKFVCADGNASFGLVANRDSAAGWEQFTLTKM